VPYKVVPFYAKSSIGEMANRYFTIVLHGRDGLIRGHRTWVAGAVGPGWRLIQVPGRQAARAAHSYCSKPSTIGGGPGEVRPKRGVFMSAFLHFLSRDRNEAKEHARVPLKGAA